ncbi:hypothetical protein [Halorubrum sp. DTA46]|uniref:hypothetical protein n=1 Tax=Halorubrum sp. DTA46 TaxID=3402162 RepID=UPI003AAD9966
MSIGKVITGFGAGVISGIVGIEQNLGVDVIASLDGATAAFVGLVGFGVAGLSMYFAAQTAQNEL